MKFTPKQFVDFSVLNHRRMAHIKRYNTTPLSSRESVAEHSYFVAFYSMILCEYVKQFGLNVNLEEVIKRALIHDIEEIISGDIICTFKYKNDSFREMLEKLNVGAVEELTSPLPKELSEKIVETWKIAKDNSIEGTIVSIADKLSLLTYCEEQIKLGNQYMVPIFERAVGMLNSLKIDWVDDLVKAFKKINKSDKVEYEQ